MSASGLTSEAQLRYILEWFGEFSELQREDFLPVLAAAKGDWPDQLAATLASLSCQDKPVSLFQCRIKLFNEWYPTWTEDQQDRLIKGVTDMDSGFGEKLEEILKNGLKVNGQVNGTDEVHSPTETVSNENEEAADVPVAQETVQVEIVAAS